MRDQEDLERRDAELGYRSAGARELSLRDWMSLRGNDDEIAPTPKSFRALVNRLRVKKWQRENPEKTAAKAARYYRRPGVAAHQRDLQRRRRHAKHHSSNPVVVCAECHVEFCPVLPPRGGRPRKFCSNACNQRDVYHRRNPEARRLGPWRT